MSHKSLNFVLRGESRLKQKKVKKDMAGKSHVRNTCHIFFQFSNDFRVIIIYCIFCKLYNFDIRSQFDLLNFIVFNMPNIRIDWG